MVSPAAGILGMTVGFGSGLAFILGLMRYLGIGLTTIGATVVVLCVAMTVTRLFLRLETVEYGDRGGPS